MKKLILVTFLFLCTVGFIYAQKNLAEVNKIQGFYVFVDNTPVAEYDVVGEVSSDGADNDADIKNSGAQYQSVRDNLLKKARLANYQADGIIIHFVNGGTDKAEILKFKDNQKDKNQAKVQQFQGLYIFTDCTPISEYDYKGTVKSVMNLMSSQYTSIRDGLIKKIRKQYTDSNAVILKFVTGGADMGDAVVFK